MKLCEICEFPSSCASQRACADKAAEASGKEWRAPSGYDAHRPRAYDLSNPDEVARLLREVTGYMQVSLRQGTDFDGRRFALDALKQLQAGGYQLVARS